MTPAIIEAVLFYVFAFASITSAIFVVFSRNPVHSVLYLILAFFNTAALFLLLGAEFLAMILIIVYVGAVAVLFLFVVMMLNINFAELKRGLWGNLLVGGTVGLVLFAELILVLGTRWWAPESWGQVIANPTPGGVTNTEALGLLLYTDFIFAFQTAGMILLVAMIGAIVLSHRTRKGVKRQVIRDQVRRTAKDAIEVIKVKSGDGV